MDEPDLLRILLAHDRWATARLLHACETVPADDFHRRFDLGPGSLHDTLTHLLGVTRTWTDTLAFPDGGQLRPRLEADGQRRTPPQLRALLDETAAEFAAEAGRLPLDQRCTRRLRDGRTLHLARAAILAHVAAHNTHHLAQCLNMLRQLDVQPLPQSSVVEWIWAGEMRGL